MLRLSCKDIIVIQLRSNRRQMYGPVDRVYLHADSKDLAYLERRNSIYHGKKTEIIRIIGNTSYL